MEAGPPLLGAVISTERNHFIFRKLWSVSVVKSCGFSMVSGLFYLSQGALLLAELIVCSMGLYDFDLQRLVFL